MVKKDKTLARKINIVRGQLEGIVKMMEENRNCPEVLIQLKAAKNGLNKISAEYVKDYLNNCLERKKKITPREIEAIFREID